MTAASRLFLTRELTSQRLSARRKIPKSDNILDKMDPQQLSLLMGTEWQLSFVTPMYQFRYTQLKSYARQLSAFMAAETQRGLALEVGGTLGFRVSFSVVRGLVGTDDDAEAVFIQIAAQNAFGRADEQDKTAWKGWLACVNGNADYPRSLPKDFVCLPLFACSGKEALTALVKSWFQQTFDCCLGSLELSHTSLQWLLALWTECRVESKAKDLKMVWTLPAKPALRVTYSVDPEDAWELWSSVRTSVGETDEREIDWEEVRRLTKALTGHFYRYFRMDLSAGNLSHLSTTMGAAKHEGRIKISNSRCLSATLTLLTECALLKMPI
ncbi:centromere protein L isoform X2 [Corythoichthys intestinalis]|nr:centromere protein L isoform X2 [Corythoichthys intestinalis]XP_057685303.1 centromere protein L isoform X2 [Corythoichthys intestinalis]XP_057685304.1 centromere protein L isoform X2 [Corythoichthys intestinalis]XP_061803001.1 centromere protein L-like [Nerophis lumbriciformis]